MDFGNKLGFGENNRRNFFQKKIPAIFAIDWPIFFATLPLVFFGLFTMDSFDSASFYFSRQLTWFGISVVVFFIVGFIDFRFLRKTRMVMTLYVTACTLLFILLLTATVVKGSKAWFDFGSISFQPVDPVKLVLIILLSKYFSRRHIEIGNFRHIFISGLYAGILFLLVLLQPDFGSAIIVFLIWFGMVLVSGISKKHLTMVFAGGILTFALLWGFGFQEYQKERIINFIHPYADIHGSGYNANQSMIAVGSGQLLGKGIGEGSQSRLKYLPEYQTDFIFAAFAEEWGFVGVIFVFILYGIILSRLLLLAVRGESNFEILFNLGLAIFFMSHIFINVGMNIGLLPITGTPIPFMSYGGSHLLTEFTGLGISVAMRRYRRVAHKDIMKNEFVGPN